MKPSDIFEQRVKRIHELIEQKDSVVTWSERIQDPDNPSQKRQIDISIRRAGHLTIVECRLHCEKQDVKWVEELMGRRISLKADSIIGVSSSGFTAGAKKKAEAHGVILRDFEELTDDEVARWGCPAEVSMTFLQFSNIKLTLTLVGPPQGDEEGAIKSQLLEKGYMLNVFSAIEKDIGGEHLAENVPHHCDCNLEDVAIEIGGRPIARLSFSADLVRRTQRLTIPAVFAYGRPGLEPLRREAMIERTPAEEIEIIRTEREASVILDMSRIDVPTNTGCLELLVDMGKIMKTGSIRVIGQKPRLAVGPLEVELRFRQ